MFKIIISNILVLAAFISWSQSTTLKTTTIGTQTFTSENCTTSSFNNGEVIPEAKSEAEWKAFAAANKPAWCYYNFSKANEKYGKLYNRFAIVDPRGIAPKGFHVPTAEEYESLIETVGEEVANLKATTTWASGTTGNNKLKFNALASGSISKTGISLYQGEATSWWTTSEEEGQFWIITLDNASISTVEGEAGDGYCIRFIKD